MSLYEGLDAEVSPSFPKENIGWSSQLFLQKQLHLKKSQTNIKAKKPVVLKTQEKEDNISEKIIENSLPYGEDEYDPRYPNDYDRVKSIREEERERERAEDWRKEIDEREKRRREILERNARLIHGPHLAKKALYPSERGEDNEVQENNISAGNKMGTMGAAIAPPPSLLKETEVVMGDLAILGDNNSKGSTVPRTSRFAPALQGSVAAKIMAKYGFKQGQGLGKSEQGMCQALQVEKTSKRGGKILHEKDITKVVVVTHTHNQNLDSLSQLYGGLDTDESSGIQAPLSPSLTFDQDNKLSTDLSSATQQDNFDTLNSRENAVTPPRTEQVDSLLSSDIKSGPVNPPPPAHQEFLQAFKTPSKVVLLRNMVGPGEVDADLEVETKEECSKYGEVKSCTVFEIPETMFANKDNKQKKSDNEISDLDRVRIFVEFARQESAVKAVIDLNGRFFGGRIVRADYYNLDRYRTYDLGEGI